MDVGIKTANDQFQSVTTTERNALSPTVGQCVWDSTLRQLMVFMNASGGNAWQPIGNALVCTSTTRPSTPFEGQVIRETDTNKELTYSGSAWVQTNSWGTTSGVTSVNNLIVPPSVGVKLTGDKTITTGTSFSWDANDGWDTDSMWTSGASITVNTAGIYMVSYTGRVTGSSGFTYVLPNILVSSGEGRLGHAGSIATTDYRWVLTSTLVLAAATTVSFAVTFSGGGTVTINGSDISGSRTRAALTWIGRTS